MELRFLIVPAVEGAFLNQLATPAEIAQILTGTGIKPTDKFRGVAKRAAAAEIVSKALAQPTHPMFNRIVTVVV